MSSPKSTGRLPKARDIMQSKVMTVAASTPLAEVANLLDEHSISGLPVTDEAGHIVGVVSVRDLLERYSEDRPAGGGDFYGAVAGDDDAAQRGVEAVIGTEDTAAEVMTGQVHAVDQDATLPEVARRMVELGVHRVLVREGKRHVGLLSTFDILRGVAELE